MSHISILPDQLINKIAAGEVIERPASIVRELIDNAVDAGATRIDVEVLHGGKKLIKVSDDGQGMGKEDALLCLERHATSKLHSEDELYHLSTLGFRGEALPSIASISKVQLVTAEECASSGTRVEIGTGGRKDVSEAPPVRGTTVEIRDIFYNTPARRKFLKTNPTELSHIIDTVVQKAFAYPETAFRLTHNESEVLDAPAAGSLKERLLQLYGEEMADEFLEVSRESKALSVRGFTSSADISRGSRSHQLIFVNKRPVKNATVNHAVYNSYRDILPGSRHPAYFIFLEIDPEIVDVNVHPAKREVKFESPDEVHRFVGAAVYEALNPGTVIDTSGPRSAVSGPSRPGHEYRPPMPDNPSVAETGADGATSTQTDFFQSGIAPDVAPFFHVGEAFIATVTNNGLLLIDQHAAHERILYERFLKKSFIGTEPLVLPFRAELSVREYAIIIRNRDFLRGLGIDVDEFGGNNVIVRSLPRELARAEVRGLLIDIAAGLLEEETTGIEGGFSDQSLLKNIAARMACHKSVRGREQLSNEELSVMMAALDKADEPDKCPHGRPTRMYLTLDDLKKMFKRK